jgi:hypothetical protein
LDGVVKQLFDDDLPVRGRKVGDVGPKTSAILRVDGLLDEFEDLATA